MKRVAIIRCEKNMDRCPLTNCFRNRSQVQGSTFRVRDKDKIEEQKFS